MQDLTKKNKKNRLQENCVSDEKMSINKIIYTISYDSFLKIFFGLNALIFINIIA